MAVTWQRANESEQFDWLISVSNAIDRGTCRSSDKSKTLCHVPISESAQRVYSLKPQVSRCFLTTSLDIYIDIDIYAFT